MRPLSFLKCVKILHLLSHSMIQGLNSETEFLTDMTLACEGGSSLHLHKLVMASASLYFQQLFKDFNEAKHPIIILSGITSEALKLLVTFIYTGNSNVPENYLNEVISAGQYFQIKVNFQKTY